MNDLEKVIQEMDFQYFGKGKHKIDAESLLAKHDAVFLDVRSKEEVETVSFSLSHCCQVIEIPANEVPARIIEIPRDKTIGVFCSSGVRAAIIFIYLRSKGYENVRTLTGGYSPVIQAIMPGKLSKRLSSDL